MADKDMTFYGYDAQTGRCKGPVVFSVPEDFDEGAFVFPPGVTPKAPGLSPDGKEPVFRGGSWEMETTALLDGPPDGMTSPSWDGSAWVEGAALEDLVDRKIQEISREWEREVSQVGMPTGLDFSVDFDVLDQQIWLEGVAALTPEMAEVEVWDIGNRPHVVTQEQYRAIQAGQKMYYVGILQKKWALRRAAVDATCPEDLDGISWSEGLPPSPDPAAQE